MMPMRTSHSKALKITYYILLVLLTILLVPGGIYDAIQAPDAVTLFAHLGYPAYLCTILGVAKIFAAIGIWQTKWPTLREWAWAGIFYDMGGAALSSMFVGDSAAQYLPIVAMLLVLAVAPYVLMKKLGK